MKASPLMHLILTLGRPRFTLPSCRGPPMAPDQWSSCLRTPKTLPQTPFFHVRVAIVHLNYAGCFFYFWVPPALISTFGPTLSSLLQPCSLFKVPTMFPFSHAPYRIAMCPDSHYFYLIPAQDSRIKLSEQ